jgi:pimeloyl-ACP methyl ester carboxylesterase
MASQLSGEKQGLLLFIHGLGGTAKGTWGRLPELVATDAGSSMGYEIGYFSYPTSLLRLPFSKRAPKIQELAAGLRNQIENRYAAQKNIALVCHSLGGLVARKYLIDEIKNKRQLRVTRLALMAVPNNGAELAAIAQLISWRHNQLAQLCRDSDLIEFLNEDWFTFDLPKTLPTKFFVGTQDRVVKSTSAKAYWGNPEVETIVGCGHRSLVKPLSPDDDVAITLRRFLFAEYLVSPVQPSASALPTKPLRCLGRDDDLKSVVEALLQSTDGTAVLVLGGPGMGKTTLTRQAANEVAVVQRFGNRRWFVELETAIDAQTFEAAIIRALGFDPAVAKFDAALAFLERAPGLLVLDNLETPWNGMRDKIENLLAQLHSIPALATLASIRGNEPPSGLRWTRQRTMHPLESPFDRDLFLDIAQNIKADDPHLEPLRSNSFPNKQRPTMRFHQSWMSGAALAVRWSYGAESSHRV